MSNQTYSIVKIVACLLLASQSLLAQEYTYDVSGNLTGDTNKGISLIHYNHLDLVDTIVYSDGRKMIYTYTGTGQKLREQTILANGTVQQKRDYDGHILFRNDTLRELQHNDGRVVPVNPGNNTIFEYQYHLTDHLGNVRTVLTSNPGIDDGTATLETVNAVTEQNKFLRYSNARRINANLFDHTHNGTSAYAERLNGTANEKYGLARSISVMPGDVIRTEVYAKYVDPNSSNWQSALPALMAQIAANTAGVVVDGANYINSTASFPAGFGSLQSKTDNGAPKAYLNWLVFDRDFVFQTGGFKQITTVAREVGTNVAHELVSSPDIPITKEGYVYIYLSNENATPVEVYFDDFKVTQTKSPIIQQTDYDPLGLTFNESSRENSVPNNFLYNEKELQKDNDLNWYDFGARMYDAALGRWHAVDPKADKYVSWSPYNYVKNDQIKNIDPNGKDLVIWYLVGNKYRNYVYRGGDPQKLDNLPDSQFVRDVIEAYQYDVSNGGGKSLEALAKSRSFKINVKSGIGINFKNELSIYNGYDGNNNIKWAELYWSGNIAGIEPRISSATLLEGLAYQALLDKRDRNRYLDLLAADPTGLFHHLIDRLVAEGPLTETGIANHELEPGTVFPGSRHPLWPGNSVISTEIGLRD